MTSPAQELTTEIELTPMVEPLPTHQHSEEAAMQQVSPATVNEEDNTSFSTDDLPEESLQAQPEPEVKDAIREEAPTVIGEERVEGCQTPNKRLREEAASSLEEMPKTQLTKLSPRSSQPLRSVTPISVQLLPALETAAAEGEDVEHVSAADTPQPTVAKADLSPIHSSQQDHPVAVDDLEDQN